MNTRNTRDRRPWMPLVIVLALAAAALNIIGAIQLGGIPDFGYARVGDTVEQVQPGGPADRAGFRNGDVLQSIEGVAIDDAAGLARLPRPRVGGLRQYRLARGDDVIEATLIPGPLPLEQRIGARVNALVGLLFLGVGLAVYLRRSGGIGPALAGLGVSAAVVMGNPPFRLVAPSFAPILIWLWSVLGMLAVACFLHFAMWFPEARRRATAPWMLPVIYGPVAVWAVVTFWGAPVPVFWLQIPYIVLAFGLLMSALGRTQASVPRRALVRFLWLTVSALVPFLVIGVLSATGAVTNPFISQLGSVALVLVPIAIGWAVLGADQAGASGQGVPVVGERVVGERGV